MAKSSIMDRIKDSCIYTGDKENPAVEAGYFLSKNYSSTMTILSILSPALISSITSSPS